MGKNMMKSLERRRRMTEARDEAKGLVLKRWEEFCKKVDVLILYTLHKDFGFGKQRLEKFYFAMLDNQIRMIEEFRSNADDDDTHYLVMADRLEKAGIPIDEWLARADRVRMPDAKYEERQREMREMLDGISL